MTIEEYILGADVRNGMSMGLDDRAAIARAKAILDKKPLSEFLTDISLYLVATRDYRFVGDTDK